MYSLADCCGRRGKAVQDVLLLCGLFLTWYTLLGTIITTFVRK